MPSIITAFNIFTNLEVSHQVTGCMLKYIRCYLHQLDWLWLCNYASSNVCTQGKQEGIELICSSYPCLCIFLKTSCHTLTEVKPIFCLLFLPSTRLHAMAHKRPPLILISKSLRGTYKITLKQNATSNPISPVFSAIGPSYHN